MSITMVSIIIFSILAIAFLGAWVYKDAKQRGLQAGMWALITVLSILGIILYLIVGRNQVRYVCSKCGGVSNGQGEYCSYCGEKNTKPRPVIKGNRGLLVACVSCFVAVVISFGLFFFSQINTDGFSVGNQYSYYQYGSNGSAKSVSQNLSGNTWEIAFDEASKGYTLSEPYKAATKPVMLSVKIRCTGTVELKITQDGVSINEIIGEGIFTYDMKDFEEGKISLEFINIDASNFSGTLVIE